MWRNVPLKPHLNADADSPREWIRFSEFLACLPTALGCQTLREAEISVRLYGQLPGQASSSLPMRTNMARRTPKRNEGFKKITVSNFIQTRVQHES
jgi:hypothetical protein